MKKQSFLERYSEEEEEEEEEVEEEEEEKKRASLTAYLRSRQVRSLRAEKSGMSWPSMPLSFR